MAPKAKPKWEIPSRSRQCCKGQEPFQSEVVYYSLLTTDDQGAYERRDYCMICWQQELEAGTIPRDAAHWKAMVPPRIPKVNDPRERGERALLLLRDSLTAGEDAEAFVLGLYLQRLRLIAARQEIVREGTEFSLYEVLETGEMITIPKVVLSHVEVIDVQKRISQSLNEETPVSRGLERKLEQ